MKKKVMMALTLLLVAGNLSAASIAKQSISLNKRVPSSQIPAKISYQGILYHDGVLLTGEHSLNFKIFDTSTGGDPLWSELQSEVVVNEGIFNVTLGSVTPLDLDFDGQYYLDITVGQAGQITPRTALTTSPYAFNSQKADLAAGLVADVAVTSLNGKQNGVTIAAGNNITIDDNGSEIIINAEVSTMEDSDELVKVGSDGIPGYLDSEFFVSSTKADLSQHSAQKGRTDTFTLRESAAKGANFSSKSDSRGVIGLKNGSVSEAKMDIANAPVEGKVLTYGGAPLHKMLWADPSILVDGDDLGNHTASANVKLNDHWLSNDGSNKGLKIDSSGNVLVGTGGGIEVDSSANYSAIIVHRAGPSSAAIPSNSRNGVEVQGAVGHGFYVGRADQDGLNINSAARHGVYIQSSGIGADGVRIVNAGDDGYNVYYAGNPATYSLSSSHNGLEVGGAEGNGVFVGLAEEDGIHLKKVGSASTTLSSDANNGLEIEGSEGSGVFIGQADKDGILIVKAGAAGGSDPSDLNNGIEVQGTGGNGLYVGNAAHSGVHIAAAQQNGVSVTLAGNPSQSIPSEQNNGFEVMGTGGNGLYVGQADGKGIYIAHAESDGVYIHESYNGVRVNKAGNPSNMYWSPTKDGIEVCGAEGKGVMVGHADEEGVYVHRAQGDGVFANTLAAGNEYGINTQDKIYAGAGVVGSKMFSIGKNTGNETLEPGDLVVIAGGYQEKVLGEDSGNPVVNVKRAAGRGVNSIFGVVEYQVKVRGKVETSEDGKTTITKSFRKADQDNAGNGDYLSIVILGPADVKVGDRSGDIKAGTAVKLGSNAGVRKIKSTTINGIEIFENGGIVGKALEDANGKGMVKVFVNCK